MNITHNFTPYTRTKGSAIRLFAIASLLALSACSSTSSLPSFLQPYRMDIQQGNWVTQQQVDSLQKGMSREQVRFALGSPTLTDVFHADRWEYPYRFKAGRTGERDQFTLSVFFKDNQLVDWTYDRLPTVQPFQQESHANAVPVTAEMKTKR